MYQKHQISLPVGYKNRGLGTTSIQDSKPREKQISPTFSYFLINNALLIIIIIIIINNFIAQIPYEYDQMRVTNIMH